MTKKLQKNVKTKREKKKRFEQTNQNFYVSTSTQKVFTSFVTQTQFGWNVNLRKNYQVNFYCCCCLFLYVVMVMLINIFNDNHLTIGIRIGLVSRSVTTQFLAHLMTVAKLTTETNLILALI